MSTRVLFVGLDSLDKDLLVQWAAAGILPTFRALLQSTTYGIIHNPPGLYGGALWPSFVTGLSPARHRRFYQVQTPLGEYAERDFRLSDIQGQPFWDTLRNSGRKVVVLDVPLSPLSSHLNGVQLAAWSTHDPDFKPAASYPSTLADELVAAFGRPLSDDCDGIETTPAGYNAFIPELKGRTGDHRNQGMFFVRTTGSPAARVERPVSIMDFAPTIGMLLGVPIEGIDGQPIREVTGLRGPDELPAHVRAESVGQ